MKSPIPRALHAACLALIVSAFLPQSASSAAACAPSNYTEAGTCAPMQDDPPMTTGQRAQQAGKDAALAALAGLPRAAGTSARLSSTNPGDGATTPASYNLPEVVNMTIFKEGEGNGKKSYTCGPSATRNMVAAMYKRNLGIYRDFTEQAFEQWELTDESGTSRDNVMKTLNVHFSDYGHWTTSRPATATDYFNAVKVDTYSYHQSVIANIDTEELSFFGDHALNHFDFVYGYALDGSTHYLSIAEEWNPVYIYGSASYQPYGRHKERLTNAFSAISKTSIHGIVS